MSGPQTAQTRPTLVASPLNFPESPGEKAKSRLRAALRPDVSTVPEGSAGSAGSIRAPTGIVAQHARYEPVAKDRRHTGRLPPPSTRNPALYEVVRACGRQQAPDFGCPRHEDFGGPLPESQCFAGSSHPISFQPTLSTAPAMQISSPVAKTALSTSRELTVILPTRLTLTI